MTWSVSNAFVFLCRSQKVALPRFVDVVKRKSCRIKLNEITDLESLRGLVQAVEPSLTGSALIPMEQATRSPKILVDSGILTEQEIPWRVVALHRGLHLFCK